jgi:adenosine kinase
MRREFGGVAGNIAYNLRLLGGRPYPMATVGDDFGPYREHLDRLGISTRYVRHMKGEFTPQAFITTDIDDNQITAFHPGAMRHSYLNRVADTEGIQIGIVAPDGKAAMIQHSRDFVEAGIPHIFDPGQGMPLFNGEELRHSSGKPLRRRQRLRVRDAEGAHRPHGNAIAEQVEALIVTRGAEGSVLRTRDGLTEISAGANPTTCRTPPAAATPSAPA